MWGLVTKDYYLLRRQAWWVLVLLFFSYFFGFRGGAAAVLAISTGISAYLLVLSSLSIEDKNNSLSFLRLLPVPTRAIVDAKFMQLVLGGLLGEVCGLVIVAFISVTGLKTVTGPEVIWGLIFSLAVVEILYSPTLWLFFRFGGRVNRIASLITWFVLWFTIVPIMGVPIMGLFATLPVAAGVLLALLTVACFGFFLVLARRAFVRREMR
ncbi:ABC-2 transporter permease [Moorella naiadis]|uniref:ABC-2 transporter permease n=1 Tax=Moorella naiadis (nom. illeg.) TaxID=3093670 RepID=UPI003D9C7EFF